jgi:hypothetical protein
MEAAGGEHLKDVNGDGRVDLAVTICNGLQTTFFGDRAGDVAPKAAPAAALYPLDAREVVICGQFESNGTTPSEA